MQGHRRFARARHAAHDDEAGVGAGDQLKLRGVNQGGDVGAVVALGAVVGEQRAALAPGELGVVLNAPGPVAGVVTQKHALGAVDALEVPPGDGERAAHRQLTLHHAVGELFSVLVALGVAVKELGDGGVSPVDDAQAVVGATGFAQEDVALTTRLTQADVGEVGAVRVELVVVSPAPKLAEQGRELVKLLQHRALVFFFGLGDVRAKAVKLLDDVVLARPGEHGALDKQGAHVAQKPLFFLNDRVVLAVHESLLASIARFPRPPKLC